VTEDHGQAAYSVRFDWGPTGAAAIAEGAQIAVVVDVLSFTTTLSVAAERGVAVYPYPYRDGTGGGYAAERNATLAVGRSERSGVSLSPASVLAAPELERLVLPSPNGSSIAFDLAGSGRTVVGACLRNRTAVAGWLAPQVSSASPLVVVAAGERWPDGSLRPAVEDLWGAGAVLAALVGHGVTGLSPEAEHAADSFAAAMPGLGDRLAASASGRELDAIGFGDDVRLAGELDVSDVVPVLEGEAFMPSRARKIARPE
jgi:2-phosphosulfolactate phosphatase